MSLIKCTHVVISLILATTSVCSSVATAQSGTQSNADIDPPVIELEESTEGVAGEVQVFTALVADNQSLRDVRLYYRFAGQQAFSSIIMEPLSDSGYYTANLPTESLETRAIEYYIQARDEGGNRAVKGFAFDPLIRQMISPASTTKPQSSTPADSSKHSSDTTSGVNWWYVALGVLAVGAAVGLASGGSNGDGGPSDTQPLVPLNLTLTTPSL